MSRTKGVPIPLAKHFGALHGWRGLCAIMVALCHYRVTGPVTDAAIVRGAWLFVDFFFVLSGFVISSAYADRLTLEGGRTEFFIARVARLWPVHLAMLGLVAAFELFKLAIIAASGAQSLAPAFSGPTDLSLLPFNLALIQGLGFVNDGGWNEPSWSISVELVAYTCFALAAGLPRYWRTFACLAGAIIGLATLAILSPRYMEVTSGFGVFRCICGFSLGCLVYAMPRKQFGWAAATTFELVAVAAVVSFVAMAIGPSNLAAPILFAVVVWLFANDSGAISRLLQSRVGRSLGDHSYVIYMVHVPLGKFLYAGMTTFGLATKSPVTDFNGQSVCCVLNSPQPWITNFGAMAYILCVLAAAFVVRHLVEVPGQRWVKRVSYPALLGRSAPVS